MAAEGRAEWAGWTEADSAAFLDDGAVFVPARAEQIDVLCALIPARADERFQLVELGAGAGLLAHAVLERFPRCRYLALDGSAVMRERLAAALAPFGDRVEVRAFALADQEWRRRLPRPLRCVLASLVVHHLGGPAKRRLFRDLAGRLPRGGALLLADLVAPAGPRARALHARQWDDLARAQSLAATGSLDAFARFQGDGWNFYREARPDPIDQPSPLADQLQWLRRAGFAAADCVWLRAGHAVYGGWK